MIYTHRNDCRGCNSKNIEEILYLGDMPLAGGFLESEEDIKNEQKIPLRLYYCHDCELVQILDIINPEILFKKYFYRSSVIPDLNKHFKDYAHFLKENYCCDKIGSETNKTCRKTSKALEFGCNDGVLLQHLKNEGFEAIGIDPSENITNIARDKGLNVITGYFNCNNATKIREQFGEFDVVTGSNVFAHVDDIREIIKAAKIVLKKDGVFIVEVHYLKDLIDKFQYDSIYHEHLCYYSVRSISNILSLENMKIVDVIILDMHGGAIRVICARKDSPIYIKDSVYSIVEEEKDITFKKLKEFGRIVENHKKKLIKLLNDIKVENKTIVGYGAPGRGTILLNYCGIDKRYLDYIVDISPLRSGKLMPGVHIPIFEIDKARNSMKEGDYFLVLAWNYYKSILKQEKDLITKGVKFIIPLPKIEVI